MTMAACYTSYELSPAQPTTRTQVVQQQHKDYSRPLHVDCSVEYELPSQAKPPPGGRNEPLLMIHPCYFRKMESQRRSPFINNLPGRGGVPSAAVPTTNQSSRRSNASRTAGVLVQQQVPVSMHQTGQQTNQQRHQSVVRTISNQIQQQQMPHPAVVQQQQYNTGSVNVTTTLPQQYRQQQQQANVAVAANPQQWTTSAASIVDPLLTQQQQQTNHHHYSKPVLSVTVGKQQQQREMPVMKQRDPMLSGCAAGLYSTAADAGGLWSDTNHSPLAAERFPEPQVVQQHHQEKNILSGKYRQYLRAHRLHPYMSMAASAFPQLAQMQSISCYNV